MIVLDNEDEIGRLQEMAGEVYASRGDETVRRYLSCCG